MTTAQSRSLPGGPVLWVVLVDYNGLADTRSCLDSLARQDDPLPTIVVDNASQIAVAPSLAGDFPDVTFLRSATNRGWAGGNNLGLRHALAAGADWVILLNNDTTVTPDFHPRLSAAAAATDYGILGPIIRFMRPPHEVQTDGVIFNRPGQDGFFQRRKVPLQQSNPPHVVEVDIVNGCCLMVRREVIAAIGLIDEAFFLIHEESDFCLRSQAAGFKNGVIAEALVFHKGSSTFQREGKRLQRYFDARNLLRLLGRHGRRRSGRGQVRSLIHHLRYSYHRYAIERATGFADSSAAVIEGLYDGLMGHWWPYQKRSRWGMAFGRGLFALVYRLRGAWVDDSAKIG